MPKRVVDAARAVEIDDEHKDNKPGRGRDQLKGVESRERQTEKDNRNGEADGQAMAFRDAWGAGEFVLVGEGDAAWDLLAGETV